MKLNKRGKRILGAVLIVLILFTAYLIIKPRPITKEKAIERVNKLIEAPKDTPEFVLIASEEERDKQQKVSNFFKNVEKGDVLLFYLKSHYAVIYRPSSNKIINEGPIIESE